MKNILVVIGGGRANGNTMQLADSFLQVQKRRDIRWRKYHY